MFEKILRFLNPLGLPLFGGMGRAFRYAAKENEVFSRLVNFPNEENAREYIELRKNRPVFTLAPANNPNAWAVLREKWQIINVQSWERHRMNLVNWRY